MTENTRKLMNKMNSIMNLEDSERKQKLAKQTLMEMWKNYLGEKFNGR